MTDAKTDLGIRHFSLDDQRRFGAASHDLNPMHIDPVAARRLITGRAVVHGVHTLLTALERIQGDALAPGPVDIDCRFMQPINVDEPVRLQQSAAADGATLLDAEVHGVLCMRVRLSSATAAGDAGAVPPAGIELSPAPVPDDRPAAEHLGRCYVLPAWGPGMAAVFPAVTARFGADLAGALSGLSYIVGMVCPGLHSVFSSLKLATIPAGAGTPLRLQVSSHDARFGLVTIAFDGPVRGELTAFERPRPQAQPTIEELAQRVAARRFEGTRAWVIGGSRGLGELTAKLLAAGGAQVTVTYASGRSDAQAVVQDIDSIRPGQARALRCDLADGNSLFKLLDSGVPDAVYYFATPRIARKSAELFDREAFEEFAQFYLTRFAALCHALERAAEAPVVVYLPSTSFIEERPKGMTAYAMAKAAAEVLAQDLNRSFRRVRVVHTRLPRLATDQTAGVKGLDRWANTHAMLAVLAATLGAPEAGASSRPAG